MASLNLSLPSEMRQYLDNKASSGVYSTPSEFVRDLIRRHMEKDGDEALLASIQRGLADVAHGRTHPFDAERIRKKAKAKIKQRTS